MADGIVTKGGIEMEVIIHDGHVFLMEVEMDSSTINVKEVDGEWSQLVDSDLQNDKMVTNATESPPIQSEHSYSQAEGGENFIHNYHIQADIDSNCSPSSPMSSVELYIKDEPLTIKEEPSSPPRSPLNPEPTDQQSLQNHLDDYTEDEHSIVCVKVEPGFSLPPTPPPSNVSDSEGGSSSPVCSQPPSSPLDSSLTDHRPSTPLVPLVVPTLIEILSSTPHSQPIVKSSNPATSSRYRAIRTSQLISKQPVRSEGVLTLTEEEKRIYRVCGLPIPTRLPLLRAEEKSLRKVRRKIKNKISAQESRRKKKEYMDVLEQRCEVLNSENAGYKKRVDLLENTNKNLLIQLQKMEAMLGEVPATRTCRTASTQTASNQTSTGCGVKRLDKS